MTPLIFSTIDDFKSANVTQLPTGNWFTVTQQMINDFANATGDKQWIHIDKERAKKESPIQKTIAHGFMSVSMLSMLLADVFIIKSIKTGFNYGLNSVRFPNPVPVNSKLRLVSAIKKAENYSNGIKITFNCIIEIKGQEKPACVAEFITLLLA